MMTILQTAKGSTYIVIGVGKEFEVDMIEVELLRNGYSLVQIARLL